MSRKSGHRLPAIHLQRAYEEPGAGDGYRVLVDHFWPRGRSRETLKLDEWAKERKRPPTTPCRYAAL